MDVALKEVRRSVPVRRWKRDMVYATRSQYRRGTDCATKDGHVPWDAQWSSFGPVNASVLLPDAGAQGHLPRLLSIPPQ
jgi:hypothetical protein